MHPIMMPRSYAGSSLAALEELCRSIGEPAYRARQIARWMYASGVVDPASMTNLPARVRDALSSTSAFRLPVIAERQDARDGTIKFVLGLDDGTRIEAVRIPMGRHATLCLSSQAGCNYACAFCATGRLGLLRNLTAAEIVAQVLVIWRESAWDDLSRVNIVFMGMGEPLANYKALLEAIRTLHGTDGCNMSARRITVSTVGLVPVIHKLAAEGLPLGLALSLHATTDELRDRIVPINQRFPLREVLPAVAAYGEAVSRRPTFEYVLLAGVNDSPADAQRLGEMARDVPAKVNLLLYNESAGGDFRRPSDEAVDRFRDLVARRAPAVTVRRSRGREILAACGQLGGRTAGPRDSPPASIAYQAEPATHSRAARPRR